VTDFDEREQLLLELSTRLYKTGPAISRAEHLAITQRIRTEIFRGPPWFDPMQRTKSTHPVYYCISYPRSGTTRFIAELASRTNGDLFRASWSSGYPFDKRWQPRAYPRTRIVKDHRPLRQYLHDDGYLIVRDGRDAIISLAWMTRSRGRHRFFKREELKDFIAWTASYDYRAYGSWASHTRRLLDLRQGGSKTLVRYEDAPSDSAAIKASIAGRRTEEGRHAWGMIDEDLSGSMFETWHKNRGKSNWRQSFDGPAALAFHETGATDMLIELGYETDPQWWKQL